MGLFYLTEYLESLISLKYRVLNDLIDTYTTFTRNRYFFSF